jgi:hypothetical protein
MFYVEHCFMNRIIALFLFVGMALGCAKPEPSPELRDPIYNDIIATIATVNQQIEAERGQLAKNEQELEEAAPQTGKVKFALKWVSQSKAKIAFLEQEKKYFELKLESRKRAAKAAYLQAFRQKMKWPDPKEWDLYFAEKRLRQAKKNWDVKQRIKDQLEEVSVGTAKTKDKH